MPALEKVARALCRHAGNPENTKFEGRPMWESYLPEAQAVIDALSDPDAAMITAATETAQQIGAGDFVGIWRAMLGAG